MELSEIRKKIDAVDDQLLELFLERMDLAEEVGRLQERAPPAHSEQGAGAGHSGQGDGASPGSKERYAYHLFSTLFELARSRQAELIDAPTRVAAQVERPLWRPAARSSPRRAWWPARAWRAPTPRWPATGCCPGATSSTSRPSTPWCPPWSPACASSACCPLKTAPTALSARSMNCCRSTSLSIVRSTRLCIRHELLALPGVKMEDITEIYSHEQAIGQCSKFLERPQRRAGHPLRQHRRGRQDGGRARRPPRRRHLLPRLRGAVRPGVRPATTSRTATTTTPASSASPRTRSSTPAPTASAWSSPATTSPAPCTRFSPSWRLWAST